MALCRLVAGALGVRDSLDEEVVADIKVIVTEACNCFLAMAGARAGEGAAGGDRGGGEDGAAHACSIRMDFDSRPDAFVISVLYPEKRELVSWLEGCDPMSEAGLGLTILKALTDEMIESRHRSRGHRPPSDQTPAGLAIPPSSRQTCPVGAPGNRGARGPGNILQPPIQGRQTPCYTGRP